MDVNISVKNLETDRLVLRAWQESDLEFSWIRLRSGSGRDGRLAPSRLRKQRKYFLSSLPEKRCLQLCIRKTGKQSGPWASMNPGQTRKRNIRICGWKKSDTRFPEITGEGGWCRKRRRKWSTIFFQENLLEAFTANHFSFNNQFRRVIEKCWFRFLKRAEIYLQQTGKTYEALRYILYKKDWEGQK